MTAGFAGVDVVVVGAGAAGLFCAAEAGRRGRSVVVLEHNEAIGRKILISGGGRCNFTNVNAEPERYLSQNPDFPRSALASYGPDEFIALVETHGIAYHEKKLGQLFCDESSRKIVEMLRRECVAAGVDIRLRTSVRAINHGTAFEIESTGGSFRSGALVVASGGLSVPQLGATGFGYEVAQQFGLRRTVLKPGLVPLTFGPPEREFFASLSGVAMRARVSCGTSTFVENLLFTHRGLSGPAILQISSAWNPGTVITVDLVPGIDLRDTLAAAHRQSRELVTVLSEVFPRRFAQAWCAAYVPSRPMRQLGPDDLEAVVQGLSRWELRPAGTEGFGKAEVTVGGIDTNGLHSKTVEARRVPGLFFVGEVIDVTGWLGGYNFQWAWASGAAAGRAV